MKTTEYFLENQEKQIELHLIIKMCIVIKKKKKVKSPFLTRCIVRALKDPNTFLFDHLLALKPVKFLEGELIHDVSNFDFSKLV